MRASYRPHMNHLSRRELMDQLSDGISKGNLNAGKISSHRATETKREKKDIRKEREEGHLNEEGKGKKM
ncbi:hypothetical protein V6N12_003187 [Hibiscus sabdariffa]|uniref:Uncharacterized protein n=1 Tax=Hibiscus sabdariffa TaxID=183260 RepID=A0ABR2EEQ4_9ROSI